MSSQIDRIRMDNTEGYTKADLKVLNEMLEARMSAYTDIDPEDAASFEDYLAEQVFFDFDVAKFRASRKEA